MTLSRPIILSLWTAILISIFSSSHQHIVTRSQTRKLNARPHNHVVNHNHPSDKFQDWSTIRRNLHRGDKTVLKSATFQTGNYRVQSKYLSAKGVMENDHAPHGSIWSYISKDQPNLPPEIHDIIEQREKLRDALDKTPFKANKQEMKILKKKIQRLESELDQKVNADGRPKGFAKWNEQFRKKYLENTKKIRQLSWKYVSGATSIAERVNINLQINKLYENNFKTRANAETQLGKQQQANSNKKQQDLDTARKEYQLLDLKNLELTKQLRTFYTKVRNEMAVVSLPKYVHRLMPTTGNNGLNNDIRALKDASAAETATAHVKYREQWEAKVLEGIKKKYIKNPVRKQVAGNFVLDYAATWEKFYDVNEAEVAKVNVNKKTATERQKFIQEVRLLYAKQFMTRAIHYLKTISINGIELIKMFIREYKIQLPNDFDRGKPGFRKWLALNQKNGFITYSERKEILNLEEFSLNVKTIPSDTVERHAQVNYKRISDIGTGFELKSKKPVYNSKRNTKNGPSFDTTCKRRSIRSTDSTCFINLLPVSEDKPKNVNQIETINSVKLKQFLHQSSTDDFETIKLRRQIVSKVSQNFDKLTGSSSDISEVKALVKSSKLGDHVSQTIFSRQVLKNPESLDKKSASSKNVKVSPSKLSSVAKGFAKSARGIGKAWLVKSLVTAIQQGDVQSLSIMGGRIGLEYGLQGVEKYGRYLGKKASSKFAAKFGSKVLGKIGGPVGGLVDVGLSAWSMANAVSMLKDPYSTKYDRNIAIFNIVGESIDIALTVAVTIVVLVAPLAGIIFAAVALLINIFISIISALFAKEQRAWAQVERLDNEIPLLGFEKSVEFNRAYDGHEASQYLQDLIQIKRMNVFLLIRTSEWLSDTEQFKGKIIQSENLKGQNFNSYVDFRDRKRVFYHRSNPPEAMLERGQQYFCKPSFLDRALDSAGNSISNTKSEDGYHCEWAFGIRKTSTSKKFKYLLIDLGNGTDTVFLSENDPQDVLFLVDDGHKNFNGGGGDDVFVLSGECRQLSGSLNGTTHKQNGNNSLQIGSLCALGNSLIVDLTQGEIKSVDKRKRLLSNDYVERSKVFLELRNIQVIAGREGVKETIFCGCSKMHISGGGGLRSFWEDEIVIPFCSRDLDLTMFAEGSTFVNASKFAQGAVSVYVRNFNTFTAEISRNSVVGNLSFQIENENLFLFSARFVGKTRAKLELAFSDGRKANFVFRESVTPAKDLCPEREGNVPSISIFENALHLKSPFLRYILFNLESQIQCLVYLDGKGNFGSNDPAINGYGFLPNIFQLLEGRWGKINGGDYPDQFHISENFQATLIDGSLSGMNSLFVNGDYTIDFIKHLVKSSFGKETRVQNIQAVFGREGKTEKFISGCDTKQIALGGGKTSVFDEIIVPENENCFYDLTISLNSGGTEITNLGTQGQISLQIGYDSSSCDERDKKGFDLILNNRGNCSMTIWINIPIFKLEEIDSFSKTHLFRFSDNNLLKIEKSENPFPTIILEEKEGKSILTQDSDSFVSIHELNSTNPSVTLRIGGKIVANVFKLIHGFWTVVGGNHNDTFVLESTEFSGGIYGGGENTSNSLYIQDSVEGKVSIDLSIGQLEELKENKIAVENIQSIYGRGNASDKVICGCGTKFISLNGVGNLNVFDIIEVNHDKLNCSVLNDLTIVATGLTKLLFQDDVSTVRNDSSTEIHVTKDSSNKFGFLAGIYNSSFQTTVIMHIMPHKLNYSELTINPDESLQFHLGFREKSFHSYANVSIALTPIQKEYEYLPNFALVFTSEECTSCGNLVVNLKNKEWLLLHEIQFIESINLTKCADSDSVSRIGAVGMKNMFRVSGGRWSLHGGRLDDTFLLNNASFTGSINGHEGTNSIVLNTTEGQLAFVDLLQKTLHFPEASSQEKMYLQNIQVVNGRALLPEYVICGCDTKLLVLEGGLNSTVQDYILIPNESCKFAMNLVISPFTTIHNHALEGIFTYYFDTLDYELYYNSNSNNTKHNFLFQLPWDDLKSLSISLTDSESNLMLQMNFREGNGGIARLFPINVHNKPRFLFVKEGVTLAEIFVDEEGSITTLLSGGPLLGVEGADNVILVEGKGEQLSLIKGAEGSDNIFLSGEIPHISEVDGDVSENSLKLEDGLNKGQEILVDLRGRLNNFTLGLIGRVRNISHFDGRGEMESKDTIILGCDTRQVGNAEVVFIWPENCVYDVDIGVDETTRVVFEFSDDFSSSFHDFEVKYSEEETDKTNAQVEEESDFDFEHFFDEYDDEDEAYDEIYNDDDIFYEHEENHESFYRQEILEEDETEKIYTSDDDDTADEIDYDDDEFYIPTPSIPSPLSEGSTFHYYFSSIRSFDIEIDSFSRLYNTRQIFYLNFTILDLQNIHLSLENKPRLVYTIEGKTYSHLLGELEITEMYYSTPEFMTSDQFLIRITKYSELIFIYGDDSNEPLELGTMREEYVPQLSSIASILNITFIIETPSDFIYCGNDKGLNVYTNREGLTSHLIGFNESTYKILDLLKPTYIYPLESQGEETIQVVDLTQIISQIREEIGVKYIPSVRQVGDDLEIYMKGFQNSYPSSVFIVNGTKVRNSLRVFLNSIAMNIVQLEIENVGDRVKREIKKQTIWELKPRPIEIPQGFVYNLAPEDLEDGVEIKLKMEDSNSVDFLYTMDGNDLIVTNVKDASKDVEKYSEAFIVSDFYGKTMPSSYLERESKLDEVNIQISLGRSSVKVRTGLPPISSESGELIQIFHYRDILRETEEKILQAFSNIPRNYANVSNGYEECYY